jgi:hypothetical protein
MTTTSYPPAGDPEKIPQPIYEDPGNEEPLEDPANGDAPIREPGDDDHLDE